jgi:hypothetical protein
MTIFFINIFFYLPFNSHPTLFRLCVGPSAGAWLLAHPIISFFRLLSDVFSTTLRTSLSLFHTLVLEVSHCICSQPFDLMGIHLFHCEHGGERMASHDVVWNAFVAIAKDVRFHILRKQTHVLLPLALQSLHCWVNIVLSVNGVCTLLYIVIANPIQVDLVLRTTFSPRVVAIVAAPAKIGLYCDWFPSNKFLPSAIKVFKCLH